MFVLLDLLKLCNDLKVLGNNSISSQTWQPIWLTDWWVETEKINMDSKYCVKGLLWPEISSIITFTEDILSH